LKVWKRAYCLVKLFECSPFISCSLLSNFCLIISVVRELKKGRQKVHFDTSAKDGAVIDNEDDTKDSSEPLDVKQVFQIKIYC